MRILLLCLWQLLWPLHDLTSQFLTPVPESMSQQEIDSLKTKGIATAYWMLKPSLLHSREEIKALYKSQLGILTTLSTSISKTESIVSSDLVSGFLGPTRVVVSSVWLISASSESSLEEDTRKHRRSDVTRIIQNGGNVSIRALHTFFVGLSQDFTTSFSIYPNLGIVDWERMLRHQPNHSLVFGLSADYVSTAAVRSADNSVLFEGIIGCRGGLNRVIERLEGLGTRSIHFIQLGVGIKSLRNITFGVTYTLTGKKLRKYSPMYSFSLTGYPFRG